MTPPKLQIDSHAQIEGAPVKLSALRKLVAATTDAPEDAIVEAQVSRDQRDAGHTRIIVKWTS
jgi:hypothetical protein